MDQSRRKSNVKVGMGSCLSPNFALVGAFILRHYLHVNQHHYENIRNLLYPQNVHQLHHSTRHHSG